MRAMLVAALVFVVALAGCSGKKGEDEVHFQCLNNGPEIHQDDYPEIPSNFTEQQVIDFLKTKCPKSSTSGSKTNTTASAPNVLPVLKLKITDFAGNATNVTVVDGNLTFDATGSSDPDGQLSAIAISVKDSNQTRTKSLYDANAKKFTPAFFSFDRPGVVNVTIAMVDERAGFNNTQMHVYVNEPQVLPTSDLAAPAPPTANDPCKGASAGPLGSSGPVVDSQYFKAAQFNVYAGATYIEAIPLSGTLITICDPSGAAISTPVRSADPVSTTGPLVTPVGTEQYTIGMYAKNARTTVGATVLVHYDPMPAAAAA